MAFKIAYGAGHYLHEAGKRLPAELDATQTREWTLNDRVARHFAAAAAEYEGVELLRTDDPTGQTEVNLQPRCDKANRFNADFALSIHHNAGANLTKAGGIEAYSYYGSTKGAEYRNAIYDACIAAGGLKGNRAAPRRQAGFHVLKYTHMPCVLMEYGFMDSKTDYSVILDDAYSKLVAYATMEGIAKVAGLKKKKQPVQQQTQQHAQKPAQQPVATAKTATEIAREVIAGKWGNGADRKRKLQAAGYDYNAVQAAVNALLTGKQPAQKPVQQPAQKPAATTKSIDAVAREVIAGKWGNGSTRKKKLQAAGYDYNAVQKRVNELL
jgi:N-acetylmuramoyl-L-alanine amidase